MPSFPVCRGDITVQPEAFELHCPLCGFTYPLFNHTPAIFPLKEDMVEVFNCDWGSVEKTRIFTVVQHDRLRTSTWC